MFGVTPETKKPPFRRFFYGGFEQLDSPYSFVTLKVKSDFKLI